MTAPLSPENPLVRTLRDLHRAEGRRHAGAVLVEGRRAIDGFLAGAWVCDLILTPTDQDPPDTWPAHLCRHVSPKAIARLSQTKTPSGWFARFLLPKPEPLDPQRGGLVLVGVGDPGNVGTLIRSAAAFACPQVVCIGGADPFGHKVIQASAGALCQTRLSIHPAACGPELLAGAALTALVVKGGHAAESLPRRPRWLVVGSEAEGLDAAWTAACSEHITLPMARTSESLNAAVAGSIACYLLRQSW
jgi:TrmH family RNA methyltransferase